MEKLYWGLTEEELETFWYSDKYRYEDHFYDYECTNLKIEEKMETCCAKCDNCIERYRIEKDKNSAFYFFLDIVQRNKPDWDYIDIYKIKEYFPELKNFRATK